MDNSPEKYVTRLLEHAVKKQALLKEVLDLTKTQSGAISEDGMEELKRLVADKQERIDRISRLDEEFDVYYRRLKQVLNVGSLDEVKAPGIAGVKELQEAIAQVMHLVREISAMETGNNAEAKKLLDTLGSEIRKVNQSKKVSSAYAPPSMQSPAYFIDKKK